MLYRWLRPADDALDPKGPLSISSLERTLLKSSKRSRKHLKRKSMVRMSSSQIGTSSKVWEHRRS